MAPKSTENCSNPRGGTRAHGVAASFIFPSDFSRIRNLATHLGSYHVRPISTSFPNSFSLEDMANLSQAAKE
jgi:hypothetical protein